MISAHVVSLEHSSSFPWEHEQRFTYSCLSTKNLIALPRRCYLEVTEVGVREIARCLRFSGMERWRSASWSYLISKDYCRKTLRQQYLYGLSRRHQPVRSATNLDR